MGPSIRYINQSAPFWDFVASMEDRVGEHPMFGGSPPADPRGPPPPGGFWGFGPWGPGPHAHHGGHHGRHHGRGFAHRGRPQDESANAQQTQSEGEQATLNEMNEKNEDRDMPDGTVPDPPEDDPANPPRDGDNPCGRGRHGRCGGGRRGGWGGRHRGWGHPYQQGFPFQGVGGPRGGFSFLNEMFGGPSADRENNESSNDWKPDADVFDTEHAFVVHISLPGANKDDIGVSWDPEKSELSVAGVIHRPGDEAFLKTLALDERKVGAFERKVRLGTRSSPAQVDVDGITAKLENGILLVEVPKLNSDFVEIKKVDIE